MNRKYVRESETDLRNALRIAESVGPREAVIVCAEASRGSQSWRYDAIYRIGDVRLRVSIDRDSYDQQSHARIKRWDGTAWQEVWSAPSIATTPAGKLRAYEPNDRVALELLEQTASRLLDIALEVVS